MGTPLLHSRCALPDSRTWGGGTRWFAQRSGECGRLSLIGTISKPFGSYALTLEVLGVPSLRSPLAPARRAIDRCCGGVVCGCGECVPACSAGLALSFWCLAFALHLG